MASGIVVEENDGDAGFSALGSWALEITDQELHQFSTSSDNYICGVVSLLSHSRRLAGELYGLEQLASEMLTRHAPAYMFLIPARPLATPSLNS